MNDGKDDTEVYRSANFVCPNCGGLWARLYESQHGMVCKYCYRDPERGL